MVSFSIEEAVKIFHSAPYDKLKDDCKTQCQHNTYIGVRRNYQLLGDYLHYLSTPGVTVPKDWFTERKGEIIKYISEYWRSVYLLVDSLEIQIPAYLGVTQIIFFERLVNERANYEFYFNAMPERINGGNYIQTYNPHKRLTAIKEREKFIEQRFNSKNTHQIASDPLMDKICLMALKEFETDDQVYYDFRSQEIEDSDSLNTPQTAGYKQLYKKTQKQFELISDYVSGYTTLIVLAEKYKNDCLLVADALLDLDRAEDNLEREFKRISHPRHTKGQKGYTVNKGEVYINLS